MKKIRSKRLILLDSALKMQAKAGKAGGSLAFPAFSGSATLSGAQWASDISSCYVLRKMRPYNFFLPDRPHGDGAAGPSTHLPHREPGRGRHVAAVEVLAIPDANYFARKAQRCRDLLKVARVPEVIEQLRLWAAEFEAEARNGARRDRHKQSTASMLRGPRRA
jgi:hypothetical protein